MKVSGGIKKRGVKGARELYKTLEAMSKQAPAAAGAAMYGASLIIMRQARENAPYLEGWLKAGGYVAPPEVKSSGKASVEMGFGGAAGAYLLRQHEEHKTKSHYFLRAVQEKAREANAFMVKFMNDYFASGLKFRMPDRDGGGDKIPYTPIEEKGPVKTK